MLDQSIGKKIRDDDSLFWTPAAPIENTKLEFGQKKIQPYHGFVMLYLYVTVGMGGKGERERGNHD
jgi:hypothetical protein